MSGKNGFVRQTGGKEARATMEDGGNWRLREPMGRKQARCHRTEKEQEDLSGMQRTHSQSQQPEGLDRSLQAQLGRQLRAIFEDIEEEPVPERFVRLLEALEAREKQR
jgi:hypothetical protein